MHDITTYGANGTGHYTYLLAKGGEWDPTNSTEDPDRIEQGGRRASGKVANGDTDTFRFDGVLIDAVFDGTVDHVEIDGQRYSTSQLKQALPLDLSGGSDGSGEEHTLEITSNQSSDYDFQTTGAKLTAHSAEGPDKLTHNHAGATGHVENGGSDTFTIHGKATFEHFDPGDSAMVSLDKKSVSGSALRGNAAPRPTASSGTSGNGGGSKPSTQARHPAPEPADEPTAKDPNAVPTYSDDRGLLIPIAKEIPSLGVVTKPFTTQREIEEVYGAGLDNAMQEAFNHVPYITQHDSVRNFNHGSYSLDHQIAAHTGILMQAGWPELYFVGDPAHPDQVVFKHGVNSTYFGKLEHYRFDGMTFRNICQFAGAAHLRDVHIAGGNGDAALSGKNARVYMHGKEQDRLRLGDANQRYALWSTCQEIYAIEDYVFECEGGPAARCDTGTILMIANCGLGPNADSFTEHAAKPKDGLYVGGEFYA